MYSDHSELDGNPVTELDDFGQEPREGVVKYSQELERPWLSGNSARFDLTDGNPSVELARSSAANLKAVFDP